MAFSSYHALAFMKILPVFIETSEFFTRQGYQHRYQPQF
jgi:hypothetical protein